MVKPKLFWIHQPSPQIKPSLSMSEEDLYSIRRSGREGESASMEKLSSISRSLSGFPEPVMNERLFMISHFPFSCRNHSSP